MAPGRTVFEALGFCVARLKSETTLFILIKRYELRVVLAPQVPSNVTSPTRYSLRRRKVSSCNRKPVKGRLRFLRKSTPTPSASTTDAIRTHSWPLPLRRLSSNWYYFRRPSADILNVNTNRSLSRRNQRNLPKNRIAHIRNGNDEIVPPQFS